MRDPAREFAVLLSATRRGARLARLLTVAQLCSWGLPTEDAGQVVAELAANAALHGSVPGRNFRLAVRRLGASGLRIEVTDTRDDLLPAPAPETGTASGTDAGAERGVDTGAEMETVSGAGPESGRGLLLVGALCERWDVAVGPPPRKTVWAELALYRRRDGQGERLVR